MLGFYSNASKPQPVIASEPQPVIASEPQPVIASEPQPVIASEREAIQLKTKEKAQWRHCAFIPIISWIASLTLAMTVLGLNSPSSSGSRRKA